MKYRAGDRFLARANGNKASRENDVNSLLKAVTDCASVLLRDGDFERSVEQALEILGTSIGADRLGVSKQHDDPKGETLGYIHVTHEWTSPHTVSQLHHSELNRIDCEEFKEDYYQLVSGNHVGGLIETFPEPFRSGQKKLGVQATYAVPVMVEGQYWGVLGLDFCRTAREICSEEIAILKTAATCIGSAIQREHNRQAKEQVERTALLERQKAEELSKQERLLKITANATQALLNDDNLEKAIAKALQIVGEGIDTDRVCVMEHCSDSIGSSLGMMKMLYEWNSDYAVSQLQHPKLHQVSYVGIEELHEKLIRGEAVGGHLNEFPEVIRSGQRELGVKSLYAVPIMIDEQYWGLVGFDDCREAKQRSESEISILQATAACIGSAIQQDRICRQKEQAERTTLLEQQKTAQLVEHNLVLEQRDREVQRSYRILAATAEASNILLMGKNFDAAVNEALQIIGETLNTDRVAVIENWHNTSRPEIPHWRLLYEWNSPQTISQLSHPELTQGSYEGIEEWYALNVEGKGFSRKLTEMPEPFRSGQEKLDVKAIHAIPIFIEGKYWGIVGFDDCHREIDRSEAELSILKTAAACIGGAIERERTRRAKEKADRSIILEREKAAKERAKLLQAVATVANFLLRSSDYRTTLPEVLQILGEAAKSDRCSLLQNVSEPITGEAAIKICAEWCRQDIPCSIDSTPELETALLWKHFPQFREKLDRGEIFSFAIDDLLEPARSILQAQDNISMTLVPILVQGEFWGVFEFDYCQESALFDEADMGIFAIAVDSIAAAIEREQQEEALKKSEKRYRTLFELSNDGIYRFEFDEPLPTHLPIEEQLQWGYKHWRIGEVNGTFANQYRFSCPDEAVGKKLADLYQQDSGINDAMNRSIVENGYQIGNAESEEIGVDGQPRYFLQNIVGDVRDGYCWGGWGTQTDITKLKQTQQKLLEAERQRAEQLEESNRVLSLRDKWLEVTAYAANKLLEIADLDEGINNALQVLGESLDCDRVCVIQNIADETDESSGFMRCLYEWDSKSTIPQIHHPEFQEFSNKGLEEWYAKMIDGGCAGGVFDELPEAYYSALIELEIQSTYNVAILVNGNYWGMLGIDYCREPRRLTLPEIAVFKTAASCVGSAIYRQQIQQEKELAELAILEERNRMAREIHDTLAQAFTGISLQLEAAKSSLDTESEIVLERLLQAKSLAKEGIAEARRSVRALRPEALEFGLVIALQQMIAKLLLGTNIKAKTLLELGTNDLNPEIEVELFRIAQEAVTNAIRYAQATEIELQLISESDTVYLQIKDNGIGFDPQQLQNEGFGLLGMQERCDRFNGNLNIRSGVGQGTQITVTVANK